MKNRTIINTKHVKNTITITAEDVSAAQTQIGLFNLQKPESAGRTMVCPIAVAVIRKFNLHPSTVQIGNHVVLTPFGVQELPKIVKKAIRDFDEKAKSLIGLSFVLGETWLPSDKFNSLLKQNEHDEMKVLKLLK